MDSQNPECNLHVESQRNASLENELFKVPFINRLYKMSNLHLKEWLVKPAHFVKTAFVKPAQFLKTAFGKTTKFLKTAFGEIFLEKNKDVKEQRKEIKDQMISHEYFENSLDPFEEKYHCKFSEKKHSLKGLYNESIYTKIDIEDYKVYLENMWEEIKQRISEEVFPNLKYQLNLLVEFSKSTPNDEQFTTAWFNSGEFISTAKSFIDEQAYKQLTDKVIEKVEKFTHQGSGWSVYKLLEFRLKIAKHVPIKGSSYLELSEKYRNPKFRLINMKNQDEQCFKWCVARHFCRDEQIHREYRNDLD